MTAERRTSILMDGGCQQSANFLRWRAGRSLCLLLKILHASVCNILVTSQFPQLSIFFFYKAFQMYSCKSAAPKRLQNSISVKWSGTHGPPTPAAVGVEAIRRARAKFVGLLSWASLAILSIQLWTRQPPHSTDQRGTEKFSRPSAINIQKLFQSIISALPFQTYLSRRNVVLF